MGVLANHVPSIEQLRPGVVEVIEESGSKRFFRTFRVEALDRRKSAAYTEELQFPVALPLFSPTRP